MSLILVESFDHYSTSELSQKWPTISGAPAINSAGGRRGGGGLELNAAAEYVERTLPSTYATIIVGKALKLSALTNNIDYLYLLDGASTQIKVRVRTDGKIEAFRDTTSLGVSATAPITAGTFYYVEVKALIADAGGTVTVYVNGSAVLSIAAADTKNTANAYVTGVRFNCDAAITVTIDDVYIADNSGAAPQNDVLGDCRVDAVLPNLDGTYENFTASGGANSYADVDDAAPDGDTSYIQSASVGARDTFGFGILPDIGGSTIFGVQEVMVARKDSTGTRKVRAMSRVSGANYFGGSKDLTSAYVAYMEIWQNNPNSAAPWAEVEVNAAEFGVEVAS